jgi:hypothetical protein
MIAKLFAFLLLIAVIYVWLIFLAPELADQYGNPEWNSRIRLIKNISEIDSSSGATSLYEKATDIAKPYIDETRATATQIKTTVDVKTEQAKQVIEAAEKVYDATQEAKSKINTLTNFWTGSP